MVSVASVEIIKELKESGEDYTNAILGTFSFEPDFFEDYILPILNLNDVENIVVLLDRTDYESTFKKAKQAGIRYFLEPVSAKNTFHPKFVMLTSDKNGKLIIGSANLTRDGYTRNAEILTKLDFDKSDPSPEVLSVFLSMKNFLQGLIKKQFVKSTKHISKILEAINLPWLIVPPSTDKIRLIHNLDEPILEQLIRIIKGEVERVTISSFLFSHEVIRYISEKICKKVRIILQPGRVVGLSESEIKGLIRDTGAEIDFQTVVFKEGESRFLHAKIIIIQTTEGSYCLTGSANATSAALLSTASNGNIELCLLRYEKDKDYFEYLFDNEIIGTEKIDLHEIKPSPYRILTTEGESDFELTEARLEGDELILEFSSVNSKYKVGKVIIYHAVNSEHMHLDVTRSEQSRIVVKLDPDTKRFCREPCYVILQLLKSEGDTKPLVSSKRWVSSDIIELIPKKRDIERITKTDGREGLIKLLNQLVKTSESPKMFLYYLQFIDFDSLYETVDSLRRRVMSRMDENGQEDQRAMLDRMNLTFDYVFNKIRDRHLRKFDQLTEHVEPSPDLPPRVQKVFNLFMFINKLIIWYVLYQKNSPQFRYVISELRHICGKNGTMEKFCIKYLDQVRGVLGRDQANTLINNLNVLLHVIILSKIIRDIQSLDPQYVRSSVWKTSSGTLTGPLIVFEKIYERCIKNLCETTDYQNEITRKASKLKDVLKEYEEFEGITLNAEEIMKNALKIAST